MCVCVYVLLCARRLPLHLPRQTAESCKQSRRTFLAPFAGETAGAASAATFLLPGTSSSHFSSSQLTLTFGGKISRNISAAVTASKKKLCKCCLFLALLIISAKHRLMPSSNPTISTSSRVCHQCCAYSAVDRAEENISALQTSFISSSSFF